MKATTLLVLAALLPLPAFAHSDEDHDRARRAMEEGRILPLQTILDHAQAETEGEIVGSELEDEEGRPVYEVRVIAPDGRVVQLLYDAQDGRLIRTREGKKR